MNHITLDNNGIEQGIEMYSLYPMTVQVSLYIIHIVKIALMTGVQRQERISVLSFFFLLYKGKAENIYRLQTVFLLHPGVN